MSAALAGLAWLGRWYGLWILDAARQIWADMPGPWWVKVLLVAVCLAIPGPQDELLLILLTRVFRAWRKRQAAARTLTTATGGNRS